MGHHAPIEVNAFYPVSESLFSYTHSGLYSYAAHGIATVGYREQYSTFERESFE